MKILLAIDRAERSQALGALLRLPFPAGSYVTLLHVVPRKDGRPDAEAGEEKGPAAADPALRESARGVIEAGAEQLRERDFEVETIWRAGKPAEQIRQVAEELDPDLLVVGARGESPLERLLLGSVSSEVVMYAPCSVLVGRSSGAPESGAQPAGPLRVVVGHDGSEPAAAAVDALFALRLGSAEISLVTVMKLLTFYGMQYMQRESVQWKKQREAAQEQLEAAAATLRKAASSVEIQIRAGSNECEELIRAATERQADVLVIGNRGVSAIERFLLGSTALEAVHHAPCSVWVVRKKK